MTENFDSTTEGLEPGDEQTQPTTDASVQPEGGDYAAEGGETTSGGEYGSEPTESSEGSEFGSSTESGETTSGEYTESTEGEQQF
jgi:hypothetical protein